MKFVARFLSLTLLAGAAMFYASCDDGGEDTKPEEQLQLEALTKNWTLQSASLDNDPRTADFTNMKLNLSGTYSPGATYNYNITGTLAMPSPWPRTGTWKFGSSVKTQIIRNPGSENLNVTYSLSGNTLTLDFLCQTCDFAGGGRVSSVNGNWRFVFTSN